MIEPPGKEKAPRLGTNQTEGERTNATPVILRQPGMTYKEAAYYFGRQYRTILRMVKAGKLNVTRTPAGPRILLETTR